MGKTLCIIVNDIILNDRSYPSNAKEDTAYFKSDEYRNTIMSHMEKTDDKAHIVEFLYEGHVIGYAQYIIYKTDDDQCLLMDFWILLEFRHKGFGQLSYNLLQEDIQHNDAKYIQLNVSNAKSKHFWIKQGFAEDGTDSYGMELLKKIL